MNDVGLHAGNRGESGQYGFGALIDEVFPYLGAVRFPTQGEPEGVPITPLVPVLMSMMERGQGSGGVIHLPRRRGLPMLLAAMAALDRTGRHFPERFEEHIENGFQRGQKVRVRPGKAVFEFDGYHQEEDAPRGTGAGKLIKLKLLGRKETRGLRGRDLARLEATEEESPKGTQKTNLGEAEETLLDKLLGIHTLGNQNLMAPEVLLLTSKSSFSAFLQTSRISSPCQPETLTSLADCLPWGHVGLDGGVVQDSDSTASGAPIVGVVSSMDLLLAACERSPSGNRLVIIDGASAPVQDLQVLDEVKDRQPTLIFSKFEEDQSLDILEKQGWIPWQPPCRLFVPHGRAGGVPERFRRAGENLESFRGVRILAVHHAPLDTAAEQLHQATSALDRQETDETDRDLIRKTNGVLLQLAGLVGEPGSDMLSAFESRIREVERDLKGQEPFWPPETTRSFREALAGIREEIASGAPVWIEKAAKLEELQEEFGEDSLEVAGNIVEQDRLLEAGLQRLVLRGWPLRRNLHKIVLGFPAPEIDALALPFEAEWFQGFNRQLKGKITRGRISGEEAAELTSLPGYEAELEAHAANLFPPPDNSVWSPREPVAEIVGGGAGSTKLLSGEIVEAFRVDFAGGASAYLTGETKVPYIRPPEGGNPDQGSISSGTKKPEELEAGDVVLFRTDSDADVIRHVAKRIAGEDHYENLRERSGLWRKCLRLLGSDTENVKARLEANGLERTLPTVRNWLRDPNVIGPRDKEDLEIIARTVQEAYPEVTLMEALDKIYQAVKKVRSFHRKAGDQLAKDLPNEVSPSMATNLEGVAEVELSMGEVQLARVIEVNPNPEQVDVSETNELIQDLW